MKDLPSAANLRQSFEAAALEIILTLAPMNKIPQTVFQQAFMGGVLLFAGYLAMYVMSFELLLSAWTSLFILATVVVGMVKSLLEVRKQEDPLNFGRAFMLALLGGWLARLGYNVFNVLLFNVMRPDLKEAYAGLVIDKMEAAMASFSVGMEAAGIDVAEMNAALIDSLSIQGQLVDWLSSVFFLALLALIVAAILKRAPQSSQFEG
ncbi:MAG: DUF4199 family protein [Alphaproteobacteria bacterium]